jgi:LPXTG-motif cell wall-anchored protein
VPGPKEIVVVSTLRIYYDAVIALALMGVVAIICGFIAAVITGDNSPNFPIAAIAFVLTGGFMFLRLRRDLRTPAHDS